MTCQALPVRRVYTLIPEPRSYPERWLWLVCRTADENRAAFRELFDRLGDPLRTTVGAPIVTATFVEVWWLARYHTDPDTDVPAWINGIAARRAAEVRPPEPVWRGMSIPFALAAQRDEAARLELAALLGRPSVG